MSKLLHCGLCCMCLSIWGIIQLSLMGVFYHLETPILIDDVHANTEDYTDFKTFIDITRDNYATNARNCWVCTGGYVLSLLISLLCIRKAKASAIKLAKKMDDDELICAPTRLAPPEVPGPGHKKSKSKKKTEPFDPLG